MKYLLVAFCFCALVPNCKSFAQTPDFNSLVIKSSILVLSQDDLFNNSAPGRALLKIFEEKQSKLIEEAAKIEKQFIREEKNLTEQREILNTNEFQILAEEFDIKVEEMRKSRAAKDKKLQRDFSVWRKKFVQIILPIIREQMSLFNALVVLDTNNRGLIYDKKIDVTDEVIKRLNEEYQKNPQILEEITNGN